VNAYIDGFNLYHGAVKDRPARKWLDLDALCRGLLEEDWELQRVRYFTARVGSSDADPGQPQRQDIYLRALSSHLHLSLHEGRFQTETRELPLVGSGELVRVRVPEEKGSDVNLATWLMLDAADSDMDMVQVVSDDFDLEEPLRMIRDAYGLVLVLVSPRNQQGLAKKVGADYYKPIHDSLLEESQFPDLVLDEDGREVTRPPTWRDP
jgi:NYN domain